MNFTPILLRLVIENILGKIESLSTQHRNGFFSAFGECDTKRERSSIRWRSETWNQVGDGLVEGGVLGKGGLRFGIGAKSWETEKRGSNDKVQTHRLRK